MKQEFPRRRCAHPTSPKTPSQGSLKVSACLLLSVSRRWAGNVSRNTTHFRTGEENTRGTRNKGANLNTTRTEAPVRPSLCATAVVTPLLVVAVVVTSTLYCWLNTWTRSLLRSSTTSPRLQLEQRHRRVLQVAVSSATAPEIPAHRPTAPATHSAPAKLTTSTARPSSHPTTGTLLHIVVVALHHWHVVTHAATGTSPVPTRDAGVRDKQSRPP